MKPALLVIGALIAIYFVFLRTDSKAKREREEIAERAFELQRANEESQKQIAAAAAARKTEPDVPEDEAETKLVRKGSFRDALRGKINEAPVVASVPPVTAPETKPEAVKPEIVKTEMKPGETTVTVRVPKAKTGEPEPETEVAKTEETKPAETETEAEPSSEAVSFQKYAERLFIIKGDRGSGSGFICEVNGKAGCVTNSHVLSGNKTLSFTRPDGKPLEVAVDQMQVSTDRDLAFFPLKTALPALKMPDAKTKMNIGDEVICLGNSGGGGVVTDLRGTILGIGPNEIEVDAPFVQGNSGSPVLHVKSDAVIGVAARLVREKKTVVNMDTRFAETRRFCTRIEGTAWKAYKWTDFAAEAALMESYKKHGEQLAALMLELIMGSLNPSAYDDTSVGIRAAVRTFIAALTNVNLTTSDRLRAQASFLRDVGFEIRKGPFEELEVMRTKAKAMCAHHREVMMTQIQNRESLSEKMKEIAGAKIAIATSSLAPNGGRNRGEPVNPRPGPVTPSVQ